MSDLRLHALFTRHAVLQRDAPLPVWGWAAPGQRVRIGLAGRSAEVDADATGRWRATLAPLPAGGPHRLEVAAGEQRVAVDDLLVGEVWLCAGQSNMEWPADNGGFSAAELQRCEDPRLRFFTVARGTADEPHEDVVGEWRPCTPDVAHDSSGTALAFARELRRRLDVPVGCIVSAYGGSAIESWLSRGALAGDERFAPILERDREEGPEQGTPEFDELVAAWERDHYHVDPGIAEQARGWAAPDLDDAAWDTMELPSTWEKRGLEIDGAVWFRKRVEIPPHWAGRDLELSLGPIDDFDRTHVAGELVGAVGPEHPEAYQVPRRYTVPGRLVRGGDLVLAVRVFDRFGAGGICGQRVQMWLARHEDDDEAIPLAGTWRYRVELALEPKPITRPHPAAAFPHHKPARLHNAMLLPLAPYALRGATWYQGESNNERAEQYAALLQALVGEWRRLWAAELPVLVVGLPVYRPNAPIGEGTWAELRESQERVLGLPRTGLAVCCDSGDPRDIHPRTKPLVGHRLALCARALVYGEDVAWRGPRYAGHEAVDGAVRVRFTDTGGGLWADGGNPPRGFELAGADRRFEPATARIDGGDEVVLRVDGLAEPAAVRYAWHDAPDATLRGATGLPAWPFRTDDWPRVTAGRR